jgi:hypothetical protein
MTDTRASGRIVDYIDEQREVAAHWAPDPAAQGALQEVARAVTELRRRGDTLVSRADLEAILRHVDRVGLEPALASALERLERALSGA